MTAIPMFPQDLTLKAMDRAVEERRNRELPRSYLGMSEIGTECERALWYSFRGIQGEPWKAETLYKFEDGHSVEDIMAERLRLIPGVELQTRDAATGQQIGFIGCNGHFRGHIDGIIKGLVEAPKTFHIWEHKTTEEVEKLEKIRAELGEKRALQKWNAKYYAQAVMYMHFAGLKRHFLTVSTPGGRRSISIRTEANEPLAKELCEKAKRVIFTDYPPTRMAKSAEAWPCRICRFREVCHQETPAIVPRKSCRSCLHVTPLEDGGWDCAKNSYDCEIAKGCDEHLFNPGLLPGKQVDATEDSVLYQIGDRRFVNRAGGEIQCL
jgi:CRISPR/Cas system-associated exonuclease Cas4 (RecB family)